MAKTISQFEPVTMWTDPSVSTAPLMRRAGGLGARAASAPRRWAHWPAASLGWQGAQPLLQCTCAPSCAALLLPQAVPPSPPAPPLALACQVVEDARAYFTDAPNVKVEAMPINDGWLRDWGPTCIARKNPETGKREVAGVHWAYDCYG